MAMVCFNVKTVGKGVEIRDRDIRKGSYLINPIDDKTKGKNPYHSICVKYFDAEIKVMQNCNTTIKGGF